MIVILNPPYGSIGSQIVKTVTKAMPTAEKIILLPLTDMLNCSKEFRYNPELTFSEFMHNGEMVKVSDIFQDANIINDMCWVSGDSPIDKREILEKYFCSEKAKEYFAANEKRPPLDTWEWKPGKNGCKGERISKEHFRPDGVFLTAWNPENGVHEENAKDRYFNLDKCENVNGKYPEKNLRWQEDKLRIFPSEKEAQNFIKWMYFGNNGRPGLSDFLFKCTGLKKVSVLWWEMSIPRVDWSKEWDDKAILKELDLPEDFLEE